MTKDDVTAADAGWFKKHRQAEQSVRHSFDVERERAIATDLATAPGPLWFWSLNAGQTAGFAE